MKKKYIKVEGIHCSHCIDTITMELVKKKNIKEVLIKHNIIYLSYEGQLSNKELIDTIKEIGYFTKEEYITDNLKDFNDIKIKEFILILVIILFLWFLINQLFGFNIFLAIPNIDSNITYGMLFITGLFTSIHCVSMCGAINLVASIDKHKRNFKRPILYNLGRVLSYTILGGIVGAVGSVISINNTVSGIIILIASLIMLLLSFQMLGIFDFPSLLKHKWKIQKKSHNAFVIGLLNGFMPCGPLQAMQLYALSTGSALKGAFSLFLFGLGTVPFMLFIGLFYHFIKGRAKVIIHKVASVLILLLSLVMLNRGLLVLGFDLTKSFSNNDEFLAAKIIDDYQEVQFDLKYDHYEDIIVQKGIPVKMIIHVDEEYLTSCNSEVLFKDFGIEQKLEVGDNIIEFTPTEVGTYTYTCFMNMIKNNIKVIDEESYFEVDK